MRSALASERKGLESRTPFLFSPAAAQNRKDFGFILQLFIIYHYKYEQLRINMCTSLHTPQQMCVSGCICVSRSQVLCFSVSGAAFRGFNRDLSHTHTHTAHTHECSVRAAGINTHTDKTPTNRCISATDLCRYAVQLNSVLGLAGSRCRAGKSVYSRRKVGGGGTLTTLCCHKKCDM